MGCHLPGHNFAYPVFDHVLKRGVKHRHSPIQTSGFRNRIVRRSAADVYHKHHRIIQSMVIMAGNCQYNLRD